MPCEAFGFAPFDPFVPAFRAQSEKGCAERLLACVHALCVGGPIEVGPYDPTCRILTLEPWIKGFLIAGIASKVTGRIERVGVCDRVWYQICLADGEPDNVE
jgi:hypothetical protein